jgi:predicted phage-related endonuclease
VITDAIRILIQGREDWLAMRSQDVTASEIAALFGKHPFKTMLSLYAEKAGLISGAVEENDAMRRGRYMEHAILAACAEAPEFDGLWVDRATHYYRSPALRLGATPDAYLRREEGLPMEPIDAKSVSSFVHDTQWAGGAPPLHIQLQVLVQAMLLRAPRGWVACGVMTPDLPIYIYEVPRHEQAEAKIYEAVASFWKAVEVGEAPDPTAGDHGTLSALFPQATKPEPLDISGDDELLRLLERRAEIAATVKPLDGEKTAIDAAIKMRMGAHSLALGPGWKLTWNERAAYTATVKATRVLRVTALNQDHEEAAA